MLAFVVALRILGVGLLWRQYGSSLAMLEM